MNDDEVLKDLLLTPKPYTHIGMHQSKFSNTLTRYKAGLLKPNTFVEFLKKFGYFKENGLWMKK
jgi:hypothetical protein